MKRYLTPALLAVALVLGAAGCQSPWVAAKDAAAVPAEEIFITRIVPAAEVIHVNRRLNYVILACTVLPAPGEEAKVFRGEDVVAELRVTEHRRGTYAAADVLAGDPQPGDAVRLERMVRVKNPEEVPL